MLMDRLIVYDKPPDTDRRGIGNIANVPDHGNASESHANGNLKDKTKLKFASINHFVQGKKTFPIGKLLVRIHILTESIFGNNVS